MVFAEALTEYLIDGLADGLAHTDEPTRPIPLAVDRYIALSAFQKAVRRGNEELALRAAATLTINGPKAIWRRLGIIAFDDVGVANLDAVGWVTAVIDEPDLRQRLGGDWRIADFLIRALCRSAKCRATDDIIDVIQHDPELAELRDELPGLSLRHRINRATDITTNIETLALVTWSAIGTDKITSSVLPPTPGCPENTFDALRDADYPGSVVEICRMGLKRTGCLLPAMFLLLYPLKGSGEPVTEDDRIAEQAAERQAQAAGVARDQALSNQSIYLTDLARRQTASGNATNGILLALEALPDDMSAPNRPYLVDTEAALYEAITPVEKDQPPCGDVAPHPRSVGISAGHFPPETPDHRRCG